MYNKLKNKKDGTILIAALTISTVLLTLASGLAMLSVYEKKLYLRQTAAVQALHIAEAGINYYRWHLAHDPDDFCDNHLPCDAVLPNGPYERPYVAGDIHGKFSLEITPPAVGSTIITIKSTGWTNDFDKIKKTVSIDYGLSSLTQYSILTNSDIWFRATESVQGGPIHSNGGIRMDGSHDSTVSSAKLTYTCPSNQSCDTEGTCLAPCSWDILTSLCTCDGVWRIGTVGALWEYPSVVIDFAGITTNFAKIKTDATLDGVYIGPGSKGIHIIFNENGRFYVRDVKTLGPKIWQKNDDWDGTVKISEGIGTEDPIGDYPIPTNGLIFVEDNVWVEGTVNGRVTLASADLTAPFENTSIIINNNILYDEHDGNHILGLIAQKDIKVPRNGSVSDLNNLEIEAILLAQNGRVFRNQYDTPSIKNSIKVYGSIITNKRWTWSWSSAGNVVDGYQNTNLIFDTKAKFNPPPDFPTTGEYAVISWEEI